MASTVPQSPPEPSAHSAWDRAKLDAPALFNVHFYIGLSVVAVLGAGIALVRTSGPTQSTQYKLGQWFIWGGLAIGIPFIAVWGFSYWMAPRRQRDEARSRGVELQADLAEAKHEAEKLRLDGRENWQRERQTQLRGIVNNLTADFHVLRMFATNAEKKGSAWNGEGWYEIGQARAPGVSGEQGLTNLSTFDGLFPLYNAAKHVYERMNTLQRRGQFSAGSWQGMNREESDDLPGFFAALLNDLDEAERLLPTAFDDVLEWGVKS